MRFAVYDVSVKPHSLVLLLTLAVINLRAAPNGAKIEAKNIRIEFNSLLYSRVVARFDGKETALGDIGPSESITAGGSTLRDFAETARKIEAIRDERGRGQRLTLTGVSGGMQKTVVVTV